MFVECYIPNTVLSYRLFTITLWDRYYHYHYYKGGNWDTERQITCKVKQWITNLKFKYDLNHSTESPPVVTGPLCHCTILHILPVLLLCTFHVDYFYYFPIHCELLEVKDSILGVLYVWYLVRWLAHSYFSLNVCEGHLLLNCLVISQISISNCCRTGPNCLSQKHENDTTHFESDL